MEKFCRGCQTNKPVSDFTKYSAAPDGLKPRCKSCRLLEGRERYHRDPVKTKARTAARYERQKDKLKAKRDAHRAANPRKTQHRDRLPVTERLVRKRASRKKTYEKNKASVLATSAEYRKRNRDKERRDRKAHYEQNKERTAEVCRLYRQANKGKVAAWQKKYQAGKRQAIPRWADLTKIAETYVLAAWMTEGSGEPWHVDHIVPLQGKTVCGLHCEANLTILPAVENISKGNRYWPDMWET